jgi:glycosyltransferase involved in cell wall biosynthesis
VKILWLSWKDRKNPLAGGAETITDELLSRLAKDGHDVLLLASGFNGAPSYERYRGYHIARVGGGAAKSLSVYWSAFRFYQKYLKNWPDLVIEEINTLPFFTSLYAKQKKYVFFHQLAREIWFYQMPFPVSLIGYLLEPLYLCLVSKEKVITVSQSSANDLIRYGFKRENISIISEGIELSPLHSLTKQRKYEVPTLLALGAVRPMKRTLHIVKAFTRAKISLPDLRLIIAGDMSGRYGKKVRRCIDQSLVKEDIEIKGRVSVTEKISLMQKSHALIVASVKEGWGLVVTEAASQGTPAVVYNVDGLRDSVKDNVTGVIAKQNSPNGLAKAIVALLSSTDQYEKIRTSAWENSKSVTFKQSYADFKKIIGL